MANKKSLISVLIILLGFHLAGTTQTVTLKTENMDEVLNISSFVMNSTGEIFLYSSSLLRVFKFKPDGTFAKSFCRHGEGPGEVFRVFQMFYNPANDFLYLPDYVSGGKGHVTIYDSDGNFKGLLQPEISRKDMDSIWHLVFLKDGSYLAVTHDRVGWKPAGKYFITQQEVLVRYFIPDGKLVSEIFRTTNADELSHAVNYGGPAIFFRPDTLVNITPDEQYIAIAQTDENTISFYDKQGKKSKTITLEIPRRKLTDEAFEDSKRDLLNRWKGKTDSRMVDLAKNMVKLEYRPIYWNQFLTPGYIILENTDSRDEDGYIKTSKLIFFDWTGKKKGEKIIAGYMMNTYGDKGLMKSYDDETNEQFRVEPGIFNFEDTGKISRRNKKSKRYEGIGHQNSTAWGRS